MNQRPPALRQRLYRRVKRSFQAMYDQAVHTGPLLPMERYFPAHVELARLTPLLQEQSRALMPHLETLPRFHDLSSTQGRFAYRDGRRWSVLPLRVYGVDLHENQQQLPALAPFLRAHPEVTGAMVSCLESGKHIRPHRGPFRGILRYHLTLHCASGDGAHDCRLRVADRWIPYREGEALLWDDTYEHEVRNRTGGDRIALLLDVRRPELPPALALLSSAVIGGVGLYCRLQRRRYRAVLS
ncbi:MAG: aspartyl/asparaginyl beta-hydroxylase domain-containing protein [Cyanobacteriota bacterium]|nr:aspartyl/asparaginyl beta-hydroxylase domain-containing protein [Cyanobacteriota bacterium]